MKEGLESRLSLRGHVCRRIFQDLDCWSVELKMETENWGMTRIMIQSPRMVKDWCLAPMLDNLHANYAMLSMCTVESNEVVQGLNDENSGWNVIQSRDPWCRILCLAGPVPVRTTFPQLESSGRHITEQRAMPAELQLTETFEEVIILWKFPKLLRCFDTQG